MQHGDEYKWPSNAELQSLCITLAKQYKEREWLKEVSVVPLQQSLNDLGVAFKNFFESLSGKRKGPKVGFPVMKKRSNTQSSRYTQRGFSLNGGKLFLAKIGNLKVKWGGRPLPSYPTSVTLTKNNAGQYHVSFVVDAPVVEVEPIRKSIGIDLGIKVFAFCSTGEQFNAPSYKTLNRKVARLQRRLARQKKGSNRREVTRLRIAKLKLKIKNVRKDFLHKLSSKLVRENQTVSLEDLNVKGMLANRKLSRAISEQGWSTFRDMCKAKTKKFADRTFVVISRWEPTSQICSTCGYKWGKLDLSVRSILCLNCGTNHDRDENAAMNIDLVGAGHAHDSKWTANECKTTLSSGSTALSNHP
jgi:putative transposase